MSDPTDLNAGGPSDGDGNGQRGGGRNWLLIGSLALNLLVVGWLLVGVVHWFGWGGMHGHHWRDRGGWHEHWESRRWEGGRGFQAPRGLMRGFLFERPDDPALAELYDRHGAALQDSFDEARAARRRVHDLIDDVEDGRPLDKAVLSDALSQVRRATALVQTHMHETLLDAAEILPPDQFEDLVEYGPRNGYDDDDDDD